jgi:hypothetical protein
MLWWPLSMTGRGWITRVLTGRGWIPRLVALAIVAVAVVLYLGLRDEDDPPTPPAFSGLATWIDNWDWRTWTRPASTKLADSVVGRMKGYGVRTLFIATSHHSQREEVVNREAIASFLEAAHGHGIKVVAWYQPGLTDVGRDLRRVLAAVRLRTRSDQRFDSFALDIEARLVRSSSVRNRRLLQLVAAIRRAVGERYRLAAIVPSPRRLELHPGSWPDFPYRELAPKFDLFLPMAQWTGEASGFDATNRYVSETIRRTRELTGNPRLPVHVIGGAARDATAAEVRGFLAAADRERALGASLYDFLTTSSAEWTELERWTAGRIRVR